MPEQDSVIGLSTVSCTDKNNINSVCTHTCNTGYYVVGSSTVACEDLDDNRIGEWSSDAPTCESA